MKKWSLKKKLKATFWLVFALGCLWIALAPPIKPPNSVTVKVEQPEEPPSPPAIPGGEERTPPVVMPPPDAGITIPVTPEVSETPVPPPGLAAKPKGPPQIAIVIDDVGPDLKGQRTRD